MMSRKEVSTFLALLSRYNEFQEAHKALSPEGRRQLKDQLVYRLMFDKKRSDDDATDKFLELMPKEV